MLQKKYSTVIFDLDGTLLDTLEDLHTSLNYTMTLFGLPEHSLDEVRQYVGNGVVKLMERAVPGGQKNPRFNEILKVNNEYYLKHSMDNTKPYPGIMDMLITCRSRRLKTGIISNKEDSAVKKIAKHYFSEYIDLAIGRGANRRPKPYPDGPMEVLMQLFADRRSTLYVGDSEVDAQAAINSQLDCVLVSWGFRPKEELLNQKCLAVIDNPSELIQFLA